jgi:preprotein translocase subunit SecE
MAFTPYKPNQGSYARGAAGAGMLVLALFASWRLSQMIGPGENPMQLLGLSVPYGAFWGAGLFAVLAAVAALMVFGFELGVGGIDEKSHAFVDLLIDTQNELQKVSWPGEEELKRSTAVVLVAIIVLGCFLYVIDLFMTYTMTSLDVLPV